jgi:RHS repeat-associated protein
MRSARLISTVAITALLAAFLPTQAAVAAPPAVRAAAVPEAEAWEPDLSKSPVEVGGPAPADVQWDTDLHTESADESQPFAPSAARSAAAAPAANEGLGNTGYYSFHTFPLTADSNDLSIGVNTGTGNLYIRARIADLPSAAIPATVYGVYNSNNDLAGDLGNWRTDFDNIGLTTPSDGGSATYYDGTGVRATLEPDGDVWKSGPGLNATLSKVEGGAWKLTYNRTGEYLTFSPSGWVSGRYNRNDEGIEYGYEDSRVTSITDATGKSLGITYVGDTAIVDEVYDSADRWYTMGVDENDDLISSPPGYQMTYENDSSRLDTFTFDGRALNFDYDSSNRVTQVTQSRTGEESIVTGFSYASGQTVVTDPRDGASTFAIDDLWRVTAATDQIGRTRNQEWTANSDIQSSTDGFAAGGTGNNTVATYDALNNQTSVTLPTGAATQASYAQGVECPDAQEGNPYLAKCVSDSSGNKSSNEYDTAGNITTTSDTTSGTAEIVQEYVYENSDGSVCGGITGQICTATDGNGNNTNYRYTNGNLVKIDAPAGLGDTVSTYDAIGRVRTVTDGNKHKTTYTYDNRDRVISTRYNDGETVVTNYNNDDTVRDQTDNGVKATISYNYDLAGRQTEKRVETPSPNGISSTIAMAYDASGNLASYTDGYGTVSYSYDAANQLKSLKEPGGTCPTNGVPAAGSRCTLFEYNSNGDETSRVFPAGARQNTTYDASGRTTTIVAKSSSGAVQVSIGYSYTAPGAGGTDRATVQTRTSTKEQGIPAGAVTTYTYDSRNQLTSALETAGAATNASWAYEYDNVGNRTSQVRSGATGKPSASIDYAYNEANQLTSTSADTASWKYDAVGNQTENGITGQTSTYGDRTELTSFASLTYASFGYGNSEQLRDGTASLLTSPLGLAQRTKGTVTLSIVRDNSGGLVGYSAENNHYYVTDSLGSVVGMFSAAGAYEGGYSYSPYGELRSLSAGEPISYNTQRYIGGYYSYTDQYKLGARYYDASLGRFTQMDPSGQESHPYAYAGNSPISFRDPTGLITAATADLIGQTIQGAFDVAGILIGVVIGAAHPLAGVILAVLYAGTGGAIGEGVSASLKGLDPDEVQAQALHGALLNALSVFVTP